MITLTGSQSCLITVLLSSASTFFYFLPMPAAAPKHVVSRNRTRKRKRRAAISSSSDSSSDSDPDVQLIPPTVLNPNHPSSSSSSSDSEDSDSDSSSSFSASSPLKTLQPKASEVRRPKATSSTLRQLPPSPSPPLAEVVTFLPSENAAVAAKNVVQEQAVKDKFRQLWMASVADGFKEDLEDIRKVSFFPQKTE
jgi:ribosome assembly protein 3